jgi:hypothetical protein
MTYKTSDLDHITVFSPEKWVDPRDLEDFDTDKNRQINYKYHVLEEYELGEADRPDDEIIIYMSRHLSVALRKGKQEDFHPREFLDATLFLMIEAWSFGAAYSLFDEKLLQFRETWEALDEIRQRYFDLEDVPQMLVRAYLFELLSITSDYEIDSPRIRQWTTQEQRDFLWKIV